MFGKGKIWMDGKLVDWKKAQIHVLSHVVHYENRHFRGLRCYPDQAKGRLFSA